MAVAPSGTATVRTNFNIPKIKKTTYKDAIQKVSINNRDVQNLLRDINKNCLDINFSNEIDVLEVSMIHSSDLLSRYVKKRAEMRDAGRSVQTLNDQLGFLLARSDKLKIAKEGLSTQPCKFDKLGNGACGIYLTRFFDVEAKFAWKDRDKAIDIFVFKYISGKCKQLSLGNIYVTSSSNIEPTPNCDSHIGNIPPNINDNIYAQMARSNIYLYEYTEDCVPSKSPRQCLPFAIIRLKKKQYFVEPIFRGNIPRDAPFASANSDSVVAQATCDNSVSLNSKHKLSATASSVSSTKTLNVSSQLSAESNKHGKKSDGKFETKLSNGITVDSKVKLSVADATQSELQDQYTKRFSAAVEKVQAEKNPKMLEYSIPIPPKIYEQTDFSTSTTCLTKASGLVVQKAELQVSKPSSSASSGHKEATQLGKPDSKTNMTHLLSSADHIHRGNRKTLEIQAWLANSDSRDLNLVSGSHTPEDDTIKCVTTFRAYQNNIQKQDKKMYNLSSSMSDPRLQKRNQLVVSNNPAAHTTIARRNLSGPKFTDTAKAGSFYHRSTPTRIDCHKTVKRKISYSEYMRSRIREPSTNSMSKVVGTSGSVLDGKLDTKSSDSMSKVVGTSGALLGGKLDTKSLDSMSKVVGTSGALLGGKLDTKSSDSMSKVVGTSGALLGGKLDRKLDTKSSDSMSKVVGTSWAMLGGKLDTKSSDSRSKVVGTNGAMLGGKLDTKSSDSMSKVVGTSGAVLGGKLDRKFSDSMSKALCNDEDVLHGIVDKRLSYSISKAIDISEAVVHGKLDKSTHQEKIIYVKNQQSQNSHIVSTQPLENVKRVANFLKCQKTVHETNKSISDARDDVVSAALSEVGQVIEIQMSANDKLSDVPLSACKKVGSESNLHITDTYIVHNTATSLENSDAEVRLEDNLNCGSQSTSRLEMDEIVLSEKTEHIDFTALNRRQCSEEQSNPRRKRHPNPDSAADGYNLTKVAEVCPGTNFKTNVNDHHPPEASSGGSTSVCKSQFLTQSRCLKSLHLHPDLKANSGQRVITKVKDVRGPQTLPSSTSSNSDLINLKPTQDSAQSLEDQSILNSDCMNNSFMDGNDCEQRQLSNNVEKMCHAAFTTQVNPGGEKPLPKSVSMRDVGFECYLLALWDMKYQPFTVLVDCMQVEYKKGCTFCTAALENASIQVEEMARIKSIHETEKQTSCVVSPSNVMADVQSEMSDVSSNMSTASSLEDFTEVSLCKRNILLTGMDNRDDVYSALGDEVDIISNNKNTGVVETPAISASPNNTETEIAQAISSATPSSDSAFNYFTLLRNEFCSAESSCSSETKLDNCITAQPDENDTLLEAESLLSLTPSLDEGRMSCKGSDNLAQGSVLISSKNNESEAEGNFHNSVLSPAECANRWNFDSNIPNDETDIVQVASNKTITTQEHVSGNASDISDEESFREYMLEKTFSRKPETNGITIINHFDANIASRFKMVKKTTFTGKKYMKENNENTVKKVARKTSQNCKELEKGALSEAIGTRLEKEALSEAIGTGLEKGALSEEIGTGLEKGSLSEAIGTGEISNIRKSKCKSVDELHSEMSRKCKIQRSSRLSYSDLMACTPPAISLDLLSFACREQPESVPATLMARVGLDTSKSGKSLHFEEKKNEVTMFQQETSSLDKSHYAASEKKHSELEKKAIPSEKKHSELEKKAIPSEKKHSELEKKAIPSEKKHSDLEKKAIPSEKKHSELEKKAISSEKKHSELEKKAIPSEKKHSELEKKSITSEKKHSELEKKAIPSEKKHSELEKKAIPSEKTHSDLEKKAIPSEKKHSELEKKAIPSEKKHSELEKKAISSEKKHSELEKKATPSEKKHSELEKKSITSEKKHSELEKKAIPSEKKHSELEKKAIPSEKTHSDLEKKAIQSEKKHSELEKKAIPSEKKHSELEKKAIPSEKKHSELEKKAIPSEKKHSELEKKAIPSEKKHSELEKKAIPSALTGNENILLSKTSSKDPKKCTSLPGSNLEATPKVGFGHLKYSAQKTSEDNASAISLPVPESSFANYSLENVVADLQLKHQLSSHECESTNINDMVPISDVTDSGKTLISDVTDAGKTPISDVTDSGKTPISEVTDSGKTPISDLTDSGKTFISDLTDEGKTSISDVTDSGKITLPDVTDSCKTPLPDVTDSGKTPISDVTDSGKTPLPDVTNSGKTPISDVIDSGKTPISDVTDSGKTLLPDVTDSGKTPISEVTDSGKTPISDVTDEGKTPISEVTDSGKTPITDVTDSGKTPISDVIDSGKTPISEVTDEGKTPISDVTDEGKTPISDVTDEGKTPISDVTDEGKTPISDVTDEGKTPISDVTDEGKTPISDVTDEGKTPISDVTDEGKTPISDVTDEGKTPISDVTDEGKTPISDVTDAGKTNNLVKSVPDEERKLSPSIIEAISPTGVIADQKSIVKERSPASASVQRTKVDVKMKPDKSCFLVKIFLDKVKESSEVKKHFDEEFTVFQNEINNLDDQTEKVSESESLQKERAIATQDMNTQVYKNTGCASACKETVNIDTSGLTSCDHSSKLASIGVTIKDCNVQNIPANCTMTDSDESSNIVVDNSHIKSLGMQDNIEQYFTMTDEDVVKTNQVKSAEAMELHPLPVSAHINDDQVFERGITSVQSMQNTDSFSNNVARPDSAWPLADKNSIVQQSHRFVNCRPKTTATQSYPMLNNYSSHLGQGPQDPSPHVRCPLSFSPHFENVHQQSRTEGPACCIPTPIEDYVQPLVSQHIAGLGYEQFPQSTNTFFTANTSGHGRFSESCRAHFGEYTTDMQHPATAHQPKSLCHDSNSFNGDIGNIEQEHCNTNKNNHSLFWLSRSGCDVNNISGLEFVTSDTQSSGIPGLDTMAPVQTVDEKSGHELSEPSVSAANSTCSKSTTGVTGDKEIQGTPTFDLKFIWPELYEPSPVIQTTPNKDKYKSFLRSLNNGCSKQSTTRTKSFKIIEDDYSDDDQASENDDQTDVSFQASSQKLNSVDDQKDVSFQGSSQKLNSVDDQKMVSFQASSQKLNSVDDQKDVSFQGSSQKLNSVDDQKDVSFQGSSQKLNSVDDQKMVSFQGSSRKLNSVDDQKDVSFQGLSRKLNSVDDQKDVSFQGSSQKLNSVDDQKDVSFQGSSQKLNSVDDQKDVSFQGSSRKLNSVDDQKDISFQGLSRKLNSVDDQKDISFQGLSRKLNSVDDQKDVSFQGSSRKLNSVDDQKDVSLQGSSRKLNSVEDQKDVSLQGSSRKLNSVDVTKNITELTSMNACGYLHPGTEEPCSKKSQDKLQGNLSDKLADLLFEHLSNAIKKAAFSSQLENNTKNPLQVLVQLRETLAKRKLEEPNTTRNGQNSDQDYRLAEDTFDSRRKARSPCRKRKLSGTFPQQSSHSTIQKSSTPDIKSSNLQKAKQDLKRRQPDSSTESDKSSGSLKTKKVVSSSASYNTEEPVCNTKISVNPDGKVYLADVPLSVLSYARDKLISEISKLNDSSSPDLTEETCITDSDKPHTERATSAERAEHSPGSSKQHNNNLLMSKNRVLEDTAMPSSGDGKKLTVISHKDSLNTNCLSSENKKTPKSSWENACKSKRQMISFVGYKQETKQKKYGPPKQQKSVGGIENQNASFETDSVMNVKLTDNYSRTVILKAKEVAYGSPDNKVNDPQKCSTSESDRCKEAVVISSEPVNKKITPEIVSKKRFPDAAKISVAEGNSYTNKLVEASGPNNVLKTSSPQPIEKHAEKCKKTTGEVKNCSFSKRNTIKKVFNERILLKKDTESKIGTSDKLVTLQSGTEKLPGVINPSILFQTSNSDIFGKNSQVKCVYNTDEINPPLTRQTKENDNTHNKATGVDKTHLSSLVSVIISSPIGSDNKPAIVKVVNENQKSTGNVLKQIQDSKVKCKTNIPKKSSTVNIVLNNIQQFPMSSTKPDTTTQNQKNMQTLTLEPKVDKPISVASNNTNGNCGEQNKSEVICTETEGNKNKEIEKNQQLPPLKNVNRLKRSYRQSAAKMTEIGALKDSTTDEESVKSSSYSPGDAQNKSLSLDSVKAKRRRTNSNDSNNSGSRSSSSSYRRRCSNSSLSPQILDRRSKHHSSSYFRDRSLSTNKNSRSPSFSSDSRSRHRSRSYRRNRRSSSSSTYYSPCYRRRYSRSTSSSPNSRGRRRSPSIRCSRRRRERYTSSKRSRRSVSSSRSKYYSSISEVQRRSWSKSPCRFSKNDLFFSDRRDISSKKSTCDELDYYSSRTKNDRLWSPLGQTSGSNKGRTQHPIDMLYSVANMSMKKVKASTECLTSQSGHPYAEYIRTHNVTVKELIISQLGISLTTDIQHILPFSVTTDLSSHWVSHHKRKLITRETIVSCLKHLNIPNLPILHESIEPTINTFGNPSFDERLQHFSDEQILLEVNVINQCQNTLAEQQRQTHFALDTADYLQQLNLRKKALFEEINKAKSQETTSPNSVSSDMLLKFQSELMVVTQEQNNIENYETHEKSKFFTEGLPGDLKVPVNGFNFNTPTESMFKDTAKSLKESLQAAATSILQLFKCYNFGREHFRIPEILLLEEEKFQLYSKGNCFLILNQSLPKKVFTRLLNLKNSIEILKLDSQKSMEEKHLLEKQLINERAGLLRCCTGGNNTHKKVAKMKTLYDQFLECRKYMRIVIGTEGLRRMSLFDAYLNAVEFHYSMLNDEFNNPSICEYYD